MDSGKDIREAVVKYSDTLYKVCIVILCNEQDAQTDVGVQASADTAWLQKEE